MLTDKQIRFCEEYLIDSNATQAAIRAGYSIKTANEQAARLLANVSIKKYISDRQEVLKDKLQITQEMVLAEYAKIAFFDIRNVFNDDGQLKPIADLDNSTAGAIASVESYEEIERAGEETFVKGVNKKVKVWDKRAALDSICKVLGFNAPDKTDVQMGISWNEQKTYVSK